MKKVRTSDEIQSEINRLEWELEELREELYASNAINNPSYDEYKNKWVFYDAYENGWSYIYVLGVVPDDYLCFYGYGVDYDEQSGRLTLTSQEYPKNFHIDYPNNMTIIDKDEVVNNVLRSLSIELEEYF